MDGTSPVTAYLMAHVLAQAAETVKDSPPNDDTNALLIVIVGAIVSITTAYFGLKAQQASRAATSTAADAKTEASQLRQDLTTNHGRTPGQHLESIFDVAEAVVELRHGQQDTQNTVEVLRHECDEMRLDLRTIKELLHQALGIDEAEPELEPTFQCRRARCPGNCGGWHNQPRPPRR